MVSWFGSQNQADYGLSVAPQNRREDEDDTRHMSRSSGLLHLEASQARVFQSVLKTGGGAVRMVHVASSRRSYEIEAEDERVDAIGYIRLFYPNFTVFIILGPKDILVLLSSGCAYK
jgi:hypothetical protein